MPGENKIAGNFYMEKQSDFLLKFLRHSDTLSIFLAGVFVKAILNNFFVT